MQTVLLLCLKSSIMLWKQRQTMLSQVEFVYQIREDALLEWQGVGSPEAASCFVGLSDQLTPTQIGFWLFSPSVCLQKNRCAFDKHSVTCFWLSSFAAYCGHKWWSTSSLLPSYLKGQEVMRMLREVCYLLKLLAVLLFPVTLHSPDCSWHNINMDMTK